ncbi:hypothetical protein SSX86_007860 [Deinandra increscens subsp. villosa]|uniref:Uncharacterized protein n=1 Tax=Deinandra increscens subsp. villosa TaxID=3103831 RepID=A0AAP0DFG7_9ASTR
MSHQTAPSNFIGSDQTSNPSLLSNKISSEITSPEFVAPGNPMCDVHTALNTSPTPNQNLESQSTPGSFHTSPPKRNRKKLKVTWRHGAVRRSGRRRNNSSLSNSADTALVLDSDDPEMSEPPAAVSKKRDPPVEAVQESKKRKMHNMDKSDVVELSDSTSKKKDVNQFKKRKDLRSTHAPEKRNCKTPIVSPDVNDDDFSTDITLTDFMKQNPVVDEQSNHSAAESEELDSSNRSQGPGVDDQVSHSSDEDGDDSPDQPTISDKGHDDRGVDDRASESSDEGGDLDSPDGHPNSEQSHDATDDEAQHNQASAEHPDPYNHPSDKDPPADNQHPHGKINKASGVDQEESDPSVVEHSISKEEVVAEDTNAVYKASVHDFIPHESNHKAPGIDQEGSDPSVVAPNDSVVEPSISKEEAVAEDSNTVYKGSVHDFLPHESSHKASILGEILDSINVQSSPLKVQSQQKETETDDQLVAPVTLEDSKDSGPTNELQVSSPPPHYGNSAPDTPENQGHDISNLAMVSFPPTDILPESPIEVMPITAVPMIEKVQEVVQTLDSKRINPLSHTTLNDVSTSSCLPSGVQLEAPLSMDETKIWNLLFKPQTHTTKGKRSIKPQPGFLMPG